METEAIDKIKLFETFANSICQKQIFESLRLKRYKFYSINKVRSRSVVLTFEALFRSLSLCVSDFICLKYAF